MTFRGVFLALLLSLVATTAQAQMAGALPPPVPQFQPGTCNLLRQPEVIIDYVVAPTQYDYSRSPLQLEQIHGRPHVVGLRTNGLTVAEMLYAPQFMVFTKHLPDGTVCAGVSSVSVNINYRSMVVYLANDIRPGTCRYNQVMAHENEHVNIYTWTIKAYLPTVKQHIQQVIQNSLPIRASSEAEGRQKVAEMLRVVIGNDIAQAVEDRNRRNGVLDTPQNYAREQNLCHTTP
jgi:hypothetical protein